MKFFFTFLLLFFSTLSASENGNYGVIQKEYGVQSGMVGYWKFNEGSGITANDSSGQGKNGTIYGASWVSGKFNKGLNFDGENDYVNIPTFNFSSSSIFTLAFWAKTTQTGHTIAGQGDDLVNTNEFSWKGWILGDKFCFSCERSAGGWYHLSGLTTVTDNLWHFFTATYNNTIMKIYSDGKFEGNLTYGETATAGNQFFCIGGFNRDNIPAGFFNGFVDEVAIWNRALPQGEVSKLYKSIVLLDFGQAIQEQGIEWSWDAYCELAKLYWEKDEELTDWTDLYLKGKMETYVENKIFNSFSDLPYNLRDSVNG